MTPPSRGENEDSLKLREWQESLLRALRETDRAKLKARLKEAKIAALKRQRAILRSAAHQAERQALRDALATLRILKHEIRGSADKGTE